MKFEPEQQIIISPEPPEPPFWQSEWMWTGVIVPIVLAYIALKKRKHHED